MTLDTDRPVLVAGAARLDVGPQPGFP